MADALKEAARTLLEIMGRHQRTRRTAHWKPYFVEDFVHAYRCPAAKAVNPRTCTCGAEAMAAEFEKAVRGLRKALEA